MINAKTYERRPLMNPSRNFDYYTAFAQQAGYAQEMALNLKSAIDSGELGSRSLMDALHAMENDADQVNHTIQSHLIADFVVPLERDDMNGLAHSLDDVCDALEEVGIRAYLHGLNGLDAHGTQMMELICKATNELLEATKLLKGFAKVPQNILEHLLAAQDCEGAGDSIYIEAVHGLYQQEGLGDRQVYTMTKLFDALEAVLDSIENAAEAIEAIVAGNR